MARVTSRDFNQTNIRKRLYLSNSVPFRLNICSQTCRVLPRKFAFRRHVIGTFNDAL